MKESLFKKYLSMTMCIVLVGYLVLGILMLFFFRNYWIDDKKGVLVKYALSASVLTASYTDYNEVNNEYNIDVSSVSEALSILAFNNNSDVVIADLNGNRIYGIYTCSGYDSDEALPSIEQSAVNSAVMGNYNSLGTFNATYDSNYFTVGIPLTLKLDSGGLVTIGTIFVSSSASDMNQYLISVFSVFFYSAVLTLFLSFIAVWVFTYKMVKPLRVMSNATKAFAVGDFSERISEERTDEIGQLSSALNNMANSLSNSEGMRRSFVANVSHELKTPMTTIGGFIDGILDGTISPDKQNSYLKIVSDEVKRLARLVTSMLDLSKIDSGEIKLRPVNFNITDTVFTTVLTFEQKIEEKNIDIRGLEDVQTLSVNGDQDLLHQVIYNIVENAVKFTNNGGYINFSIYDTFDRIFVSIENSGQGIASEDLPLIFDKFYKTDKSRSQDKNGMGLGLYLVKTIVNLHRGEITVQSVVDNYTKFEFCLPKIKTELTQKQIDTAYNIQDVE